VISYFNNLIYDRVPAAEAVIKACEVQMRPVMMTCIAACVGLLPAAVSNGIGSQVQKPLALVVVGGITLAPLLILVILPVLINRFGRKDIPPDAPPSVAEGVTA
jgi:cobalt-zinc-cadmium resistance protein CzcA